MCQAPKADPGPPPLRACFTLDFELDFGGRTGTLESVRRERELEALKGILRRRRLPLSVFVQTSLLDSHPECLGVLKDLGDDFHSHSHTHATGPADRRDELGLSLRLVRERLGAARPGYRAPRGVLRPEDPGTLLDLDAAFDASVFPSWRPGAFNHRRSPLESGLLPGGLLELPFAVIPRLRLPLGISYVKLLGFPCFQLLIRRCGLPRTVVFYAHLHDLVVLDGLRDLPARVRWAFARGSGRGLSHLDRLAGLLAGRGYEFLTMTELAARLRAGPPLPAYGVDLRLPRTRVPAQCGP